MQNTPILTPKQRKIAKLIAKDAYGRGNIDLPVPIMAKKYGCHKRTIQRILRFFRIYSFIEEIKVGAYEVVKYIKKELIEFLNNPHEWWRNRTSDNNSVTPPVTPPVTPDPMEKGSHIHIEQEDEVFVNVSDSPKPERKKDLKKHPNFIHLKNNIGNIAYSFDWLAMKRISQLSEADLHEVILRFTWFRGQHPEGLECPSASIMSIMNNLHIQKDTKAAKQQRKYFADIIQFLDTCKDKLKSGFGYYVEDEQIILHGNEGKSIIEPSEKGFSSVRRFVNMFKI